MSNTATGFCCRMFPTFSGGSVPVFFLLGLFFFGYSCTRPSQSEYSVKSGPFRQTVIEKGELQAISEVVVLAPESRLQSQMKIIWMAEHGQQVRKGDSLMKFDPAPVFKLILDAESGLDNKLAARVKQDVGIALAVEDAKAAFKSEEATYDLRKLEMERVKFEPENKRRIKELEFQQATIRMNKVLAKLERQPTRHSYDRLSSDTELKQRRATLQAAHDEMEKLVLYSPGDGIFQLGASRSTDATLKIGDNVYSGNRVGSIPDLSHMKVISEVRETDISRIREGMSVKVRLDALPSVSFAGEVFWISKICLDKGRGKVFDVLVRVADSDERLKPGMTVNCEYICYESDQELYVPNDCLLLEDGKAFVFVSKAGKHQRMSVKTGPSNAHYTVIHTELPPGLELVPCEEVLNK